MTKEEEQRRILLPDPSIAAIKEKAVIKDEDKDDRGDAPPFVRDSKAGGGRLSLSFPDCIKQGAFEARDATEKDEGDPLPRLPRSTRRTAEKKEDDHPPSITGVSATAKPTWTGDTKCCTAFALGVTATIASVGCTVAGCSIK